MFRTFLLLFFLMDFTAFLTGPGFAQVENLRVTEIDPDADQVELTNTGAGFVTATDHPFCHRFSYGSAISGFTSIQAGTTLVYSIFRLNDTDSDFWLYVSEPFTTAANIVHGVKYGSDPNVGRTGLAATVGLWPSGTAYAPAPTPGTTLAYDGFGVEPADWYVDGTPSMGTPDVTTPATVPSGLTQPSGLQDFEAMSLGDEVFAVVDWSLEDASAAPGMFTVRCVRDVQSVTLMRTIDSQRWLRVRDQEAVASSNRFSTSAVSTAFDPLYRWTFWVNLEQVPPGGTASKPRILVQHDNGGFANAWGVAFTQTGADLVVEGIGGPAVSTSLYTLTSPTAVGDWVEIQIEANLLAQTVCARVNGGSMVLLATDLSPTADPRLFRLSYDGGGLGNVMTLLVDDIALQVDDATDVATPLPRTNALHQAVPNPFNPQTMLSFDVAAAGEATLEIYDVAGRLQRHLLREPRAVGTHHVRWDGRDDDGRALASGSYLVRYRIAGFESVRKVTLVH